MNVLRWLAGESDGRDVEPASGVGIGEQRRHESVGRHVTRDACKCMGRARRAKERACPEGMWLVRIRSRASWWLGEDSCVDFKMLRCRDVNRWQERHGAFS